MFISSLIYLTFNVGQFEYAFSFNKKINFNFKPEIQSARNCLYVTNSKISLKEHSYLAIPFIYLIIAPLYILIKLIIFLLCRIITDYFLLTFNLCRFSFLFKLNLKLGFSKQKIQKSKKYYP